MAGKKKGRTSPDPNETTTQENTPMSEYIDQTQAQGDDGEGMQVRVQGYMFQAPVRYHAGHVLTEVEARVLQQTLAENLRNNFAPNVRKAIEAAIAAGGPNALLDQETLETLRVDFGKYAADYAFNAPRGPQSAGTTPLEREALKVALAVVNARAAKQGLKLTKADRDALAKEYAQKPGVIEEARRRVEATTASLSDLVDG